MVLHGNIYYTNKPNTMTKQFTPKQLWSTNGIQTIDTIKLTNFTGYDFHESMGRVEYAIGNTIEDVFTPLINGSVELPEEVVNNWGASDEPVIDYVIAKLGL